MFIGKTDAEAPILWLPDAKSQLMEKTMMLGKTEVRRRRGRQRMRRLDDITDSTDTSLNKLQGLVNSRETWSATVGLSHCTTTKYFKTMESGSKVILP